MGGPEPYPWRSISKAARYCEMMTARSLVVSSDSLVMRHPALSLRPSFWLSAISASSLFSAAPLRMLSRAISMPAAMSGAALNKLEALIALSQKLGRSESAG